jgi:hypothetical protein
MTKNLVEIQNKNLIELCNVIKSWLEIECIKNLNMNSIICEIDSQKSQKSYFYWKSSIDNLIMKIHFHQHSISSIDGVEIHAARELNKILQGISKVTNIEIPAKINMQMSLVLISCS